MGMAEIIELIMPMYKDQITELDVAASSGELVRCKDCKYWDADEHDCNIKIGWFACGADWFCADGERKEE